MTNHNKDLLKKWLAIFLLIALLLSSAATAIFILLAPSAESTRISFTEEYVQAYNLKTPRVDNTLGLTLFKSTNNSIKPSASLLTDAYTKNVSDGVFSVNSNDKTEITVASANLLYGDISTRIEYMKQFFRDYSPDIAGLQEIGEPFDELIEYLSKEENGAYSLVDKTVPSSGKANMTGIIYSTKRFELAEGELAHGAFHYKDCWPTSNSKVLSWAVLKDKTSGKLILAMNTHFSVYVSTYTGYTADDAVEWRKSNTKEVLLTLDKIYEEFGQLPTVFTGDFNMENSEISYRTLLRHFEDSQMLAPDAKNFLASFNPQNGQSHALTEKYPIDHIFISKNDWNVNSYKVIRDDYTIKMSDHYPILTKLTLKETCAPKCSHLDGKYSGEETVTLNAANIEGLKIYYTLDGSDPKTNGKEYKSAIKISGNKILKAVCEYSGSFSDMLTVNFFSADSSPLVITRVIKNSPAGADLYEGFELVNISDEPVDLADFRAFYISADDENTLSSYTFSDIIKNMRLASIREKYILSPGQTAFVSIIFSDHYRNNSEYKIVSFDETEGIIYNTDEIRRAYKEQTGKEIPKDVLIVPLERTSASFFENKKISNLSQSFNLENNKYAKLFITYAYEETPENHISSAYIPQTSGEGVCIYLPEKNGYSKYSGFIDNKFNIGIYQKSQHMLLKNIMSSVPENFDSKLISGESQSTTAQSTTKVPVTTKPSITTKPNDTTKHDVTIKPNGTTVSDSCTTDKSTTTSKVNETSKEEVSKTDTESNTSASTDSSEKETLLSPEESTTFHPILPQEKEDDNYFGLILMFGTVILALIAFIVVMTFRKEELKNEENKK